MKTSILNLPLLILSLALAACGGGGGGYGGGGNGGGNPPPPPPPPPPAGSLQFEVGTPPSIGENAGTVILTITRTGGTTGEVSVNLATSDGSATAGADYTALNTTVRFAAGDSTPQMVRVDITEDSAREPDETLTVTLSAATGGASIGANSTLTVTIRDNDTPPPPAGSLEFQIAPPVSVNENAGTAILTVTRTGGSTGAVNATVTTSDGSATAGADYTALPPNTIVSFEDGDSTPKTVEVTIIDDPAAEQNESLTATLSAATGGAIIGANSTLTVTIRDNDTPPPPAGSLQFQIEPPVSVNENAGPATVIVTRTGGSAGLVTATVTSSDGTATAGTDYTALPAGTIVTFTDGDSADKTVTVAITDDSDVEQFDETLALTLSAATGGASIGADATATVTIHDDDVPNRHNLTLSVSGDALERDNPLSMSLVRVSAQGMDLDILMRNGENLLNIFDSGTNFTVSILRQPSFPAVNCNFINNGTPVGTTISGTIEDTDITVTADCAALPPLDNLKAEVNPLETRVVRLSWTNPQAPLQQFNLMVSTEANCDFLTCSLDVSERHFGISNPTAFVDRFKGDLLKHGQVYYFQIETMYGNAPGGTRGLSNKASARPNAVAFDRSVNAITTAPSGKVFVGGSFKEAGVSSGSLEAFDTRTGGRAGVNFPAVDGVINAVVGDGNGGWFIGGDFTHVGGLALRNLAHVDANGNADPNFRWQPHDDVRALARDPAGPMLFVGGSFQSITAPDGSVVPCNFVAAIAADGSRIVDWAPALTASVKALAIMDRKVYIGGDFDAGVIPRFLALFPLNAGGSPSNNADLSFNMELDGPVAALTVAGGTTLYVGGRFGHGNNQGKPVNLAKVDLINGVPTLSAGFRPNPSAANGRAEVRAIAVSRDGNFVYAGGLFDSINTTVVIGDPVDVRNLAAIGVQIGLAFPWSPNPDGAVSALAVAEDGTVYVGGGFSAIGSPQSGRVSLAAISPILGRATDGSALNFQPNPRGERAASDVKALVVSGNTLYAGGNFRYFGNAETRNSLAALDAQGSLLPWNPGISGRGEVVNALKFFFHGGLARPLVYVGGSFSFVNSVIQPNLAAVDGESGALIDNNPAGDNPGFKGIANGTVHALSVLETQDVQGLYVGGDFTQLGDGVPIQFLGKLFLHNGTADLRFAPVPHAPNPPNGVVRAVAAVVDGNSGDPVVYAGGDFMDIANRVDNSSRRHFAKLNAHSGAALNGWVQNPNGPVNAIVVAPNNVVYVGGRFSAIFNAIRGVSVNTLAALDIDGRRVFAEFASRTTPDDEVRALAHFPNRVVVGGTFAEIGGQPMSNFATLTGMEQLDTPAGDAVPGLFTNGPAFAIELSSDNKIYIGGSFTGLGGAVRGNFGALHVFTGEVVQ
jgi:hypothetical protein